MKQITFYLDFISPYAYLAFEKLPEALAGISHTVSYKPILFAAILQRSGQKGPAEMPGKREWTYRQIAWLAHTHGIELQMPQQHPFNPIPLLRLALACSADGLPNRFVCESVFRHVWRGGADAADTARLDTLTRTLAPSRETGDQAVKDQLRQHTDDAIAAGVFGVPSFAVDDKLFWGFDALPMLRAYLAQDAWFGTGAWERAAALPSGVQRG